MCARFITPLAETMLADAFLFCEIPLPEVLHTRFRCGLASSPLSLISLMTTDVSVHFSFARHIDVYDLRLNCSNAVVLTRSEAQKSREGTLLRNRRGEHVSVDGLVVLAMVVWLTLA